MVIVLGGIAANEKVVDDSWSFKDVNRSETSYLTHGYHTYPAKFIPQSAQG